MIKIIKKALAIVILTSYFLLNAQFHDAKTLYISRTTKIAIPKDFVLYRDIVNELQTLQSKKEINESQILRLQLVTGIANRIKSCLSKMKINPSEIADDFFKMEDFSPVEKNIESYIKRAVPCSFFEQNKYFKVIQTKLKGAAAFLPAWAVFKYFINEDTLIDINKYLFMVEKIGIDLFSILSEKDKEAKIKATLDNKDFVLSEKVTDLAKIKSNLQASIKKTIEQIKFGSDLEELKKYVARLEQEKLKSQSASKEEKEAIDKKILDMNLKIANLVKAQEEKDKKDKEDKELKHKQDEQKRKEELEKQIPTLINSLLSLSNELNILSDISKGIIKIDIKSNEPEKKKETGDDKGSQPNQEPVVEKITSLPDMQFQIARLRTKYAEPEEFANAYIKLEKWVHVGEFATKALEDEYQKLKASIEKTYFDRKTKDPKNFDKSLKDLIDKLCQDKKESEAQCPPIFNKHKKPSKANGSGKKPTFIKFKTMPNLNKDTKE